MEFFLSENFPELSITGFSKDYFSYRNVVLAVARYRVEVPSPPASGMDALASSHDYYVSANGECVCDPADLNSTDESLKHTVLKTTITGI